MAEVLDSIKVCSFDIFDTTLGRCVALPKDLFLLMRGKLDRKKYNLPAVLVENFQSLRIQAELAARFSAFRRGDREINLNDIYKHLAAKAGLDRDQSQYVMNIEMQVEYESIYPIALTAREINFVRMQNKRIIFTSDMYLPTKLIIRILQKARVYKDGEDKIYLSNEHGFKKSDGSMFRHILDVERCKANELAHFGDDVHSDIYIPFNLGVVIYKTSLSQIMDSLRFHSLKRIFNLLGRVMP